MARFLVGDSLGNLKSVLLQPDAESTGIKTDIHSLLELSAVKGKAVQGLAIRRDSPSAELLPLAATREDGSVTTYTLDDADQLNIVSEWQEPRFRSSSTFIGIDYIDSGVYTCTSNGALRLTSMQSTSITETATLPMRLSSWKLSPDCRTFAYGGDEVELSVWDTELSFSVPLPSTEAGSSSAGSNKKRKRGDALLPAEIWRAKNVPNDELSLRVPVFNTSLAYIHSSTSKESQKGSSVHILTGTQIGRVRRYDTRAARRPVADWRGIVKAGGVKSVQSGKYEHEAFVADHHSNLMAIDLRNGKILYAYKGISAGISSHTEPTTHAPHLLASTSNDRYFRLHSTYPPPGNPNDRQEEKGDVIAKVYLGAIPTAVVWDGRIVEWRSASTRQSDEEGSENDEDVWDQMQNIGDDEESDTEGALKTNGHKKSRT